MRATLVSPRARAARLGGTHRRYTLLFGLVAALVVEALFRGGSFHALDQRWQDLWFQWQGQRAEAQRVVIVAIDEETLVAFPDEPMVFWTARLATTIGRLRAAGARVVGLDMLLSFSPERWLGQLGAEMQGAARDYDRPFREEVNSGRLILAATRQGSGAQDSDYILPSPDYLLALPDLDIPRYIGLADLYDEGDGIQRRYLVAPVAGTGVIPPAEGAPVLSLPALLAMHAAGVAPHSPPWRLGGREVRLDQPPTPIPYLGPPGAIPRVSLKAILEGDSLSAELADLVRDKVVLIGTTAPGFNDDHFTPYTTRLLAGRGPLMPGIEIHANVIESLLAGSRLEPLGDHARVAILVALVALAVLAFGALAPGYGALLWLAALPVPLLAGFLAFRFGILAPITPFVAAPGLVLLAVLGLRLSGEERERRRLRQMFGRYVSDQVVEALLQTGSRLELGGQSQSVTVLFSDIRNFTTISERLQPREVVELLNSYFARACPVLQAEGGSIDKFIGDAIMVEFGAPLPMADHAARAVRAAVALHAVAEAFAAWVVERFPNRDLPPFAVGIGLHSGEAVIGNIGSPTRMEFTAIGDTVNLASRLEGMTKVMGCAILASESTVAAAREVASYGRSEVVQVKGRAAPIEVYEVLGIQSGGSNGT